MVPSPQADSLAWGRNDEPEQMIQGSKCRDAIYRVHPGSRLAVAARGSQDQNVGTRFIASTLAHMEPGPGRDKSRPYIPSSFLKVHHCALRFRLNLDKPL